MGQIPLFILLGLGTGALYALGAHGIVLIYRGSGVINFSHGAMALLAAAAFADLRQDIGLPLIAALGIAVGLAALAGFLIDFAVMRRIRQASPLARLVVTLGVLGIIESLVIVRYGSGLRFVDPFLPNQILHLGSNTAVGIDRLLLLAIASAVTAGLWLLYRFTEFGRQTTAVAENARSAAAAGISPNQISALNWTLGAALAGLTGVLMVPLTGLMPAAMVLLINPLLAAALVGQFKSFPLTLLGGLIVGVAQSLIGYFGGGAGWSTSAPFLVIILVLALKGHALPLRGYITDRLPRVATPGPVSLYSLLVFLSAVALILFLPEDWVNAITASLLAATVMLSIVTVTGLAGQVSLAQFAFAGMGAFISARLAAVYGLPFPLVFVIAVATTVPVGILFALPALRTRGVNLAIVTLGLGLVVDRLIFKNIDYTGGFAGTRIETPRLFGWSLDAIDHPERFAILTLILFALCAVALSNVHRGASGRRLLAARCNERAASALGISVVGAKLYAFALAAAFAAAGGALGAFRYPNVRFDVGYSAFESIPALLMTFLGGIGFIGGALIGGLMSAGGVMNELLSALIDLNEWQGFVIGLGAIIMVMTHPDGLATVFLKDRRGKVSAPSPPPDANISTKTLSRCTPMSLQVDQLCVHFGGLVALDSVTFAARPGQVLGVIGPNGAGKTTLIDTITGFTPVHSGSIHVESSNYTSLSAITRARGGLGRSFQNLELFDDLSVADNIRVACDSELRRLYFTDLVQPRITPFPESAEHVIDVFGLRAVLERIPAELSFGQRRALSIARTVASMPSVLLLDEPAAGLDPKETRELGEIIRWLAEELGMAILLVEHNMGLVMQICDRIVVLDFGHKITEGLPDDVRINPAVIAAYLGVQVDDGSSVDG